MAAGIEIMLAPQRDRALGGVVVDLDTSVIAVTDHPLPQLERVGYRAGQRRIARDPVRSLRQLVVQSFEQWAAVCPARGLMDLGRSTADRGLYRILGADVLQSLLCLRRVICLGDLVELLRLTCAQKAVDTTRPLSCSLLWRRRRAALVWGSFWCDLLRSSAACGHPSGRLWGCVFP